MNKISPTYKTAVKQFHVHIMNCKLHPFHEQSLHFLKNNRIMKSAVLGGEVAVPYNLQSAIARLNSHLRYGDFMVCLKGLVLTFRSYATGTHESCQRSEERRVGKECR